MSGPPPSPNAVAWFDTHLLKNTTELRSPTTEARRCGSEFDRTSTDAGVRTTSQSENPSRRHWSPTASSPEVSLTLPVAISTERSVVAGSIGVQLQMLSRLVPCVSGNGVFRSWSTVSTWLPTCLAWHWSLNCQFRPHLLCLPVFVLQALESNCQFGQARLGVTFNQPFTFFSPLKTPHTGQRVDPFPNLLHPTSPLNGPVRVRPKAGKIFKRLDPTTWSEPTAHLRHAFVVTHLEASSFRDTSKSPASPTGLHQPVLKPVDVERDELGHAQPTNRVEASRLLASMCSKRCRPGSPENSDPLEEHRPPLCAVYLRQLGTTNLLVLSSVPVA